ncbi:hypothetical protein [Paraburkholderia sp. LEh10]|nr:hypothetical protein [Paraburkholderia sp. LEh10]
MAANYHVSSLLSHAGRDALVAVRLFGGRVAHCLSLLRVLPNF